MIKLGSYLVQWHSMSELDIIISGSLNLSEVKNVTRRIFKDNNFYL